MNCETGAGGEPSTCHRREPRGAPGTHKKAQDRIGELPGALREKRQIEIFRVKMKSVPGSQLILKLALES
eukprot:578902-Pyramimonas_sp.AAC.1